MLVPLRHRAIVRVVRGCVFVAVDAAVVLVVLVIVVVIAVLMFVRVGHAVEVFVHVQMALIPIRFVVDVHDQLSFAERPFGSDREGLQPALSISRAAFQPGAPITPPPGCAADPHRNRLAIGVW